MKFAILSDIHGNIFALEECFKYIEKMQIDGIIWCGDYITDIPKSHEIIMFIQEKMKQYKSYIVRGNREEYIINYDKCENKKWSMENRNGPLLCAYNELTKSDLNFIFNLPKTCVIDIQGLPKIFVSHKRNIKDSTDCTYEIFGHTHRQYVYERNDIRYINPGSVGLTNGNGQGAEFSVLELDKYFHKIENYHIKYDISRPIELIKNSMLDKTVIKWGDVLIKVIETGIDYNFFYVKEVNRLAKKYGFDTDLDNVPIELWHEARREVDEG